VPVSLGSACFEIGFFVSRLGRTGAAKGNAARCPAMRCDLWILKFGASGYSGFDDDQQDEHEK
jgi:hypothetical protein